MKRIVTLMVSVGVLVGGLAGCGGNNSSDAVETAGIQHGAGNEDVRIVKWADTFTSAEFESNGSPAAVAINSFCEKLEELSSGKMKVQIYPDGQLASTNDEIVGGLKNGAFDCTSQNTGNWSEYSPAFYFMNVPFLFTDAEEAYATLDGEIGQAAVQRIKEDTGIYIYGFADIGFRQITNKEFPIKSPDDLKGVKIRTMVDDVQVAAFNALGAAVTPLSFGELFTALQQGLVDAQENPLSNIVNSRFYEVQNYITLSNHCFTVTSMAFSPYFIESLTDEERGWVEEAVLYGQEQGRASAAEFEEKYLEMIGDYMEVYEPSEEELLKFRDAVEPAWDKVEELMGTENFEELVTFVEDYRAANQ